MRTLKGWDIRTDHAKFVLYFVEVACLFACIFSAQFIRHSKLGRILVAMRDKEDRVRFSGYSVANFKIFAFALAAVFAAIGGAMFTLQVGFMSPSFVGIVPSIEMVIYAAVGGRMSIFGAVYGRCWSTSPRRASRNRSRKCGCSAWARCSSPSCSPSPTVLPASGAITFSPKWIGCRVAQIEVRQWLNRQSVADNARRSEEQS